MIGPRFAIRLTRRWPIAPHSFLNSILFSISAALLYTPLSIPVSDCGVPPPRFRPTLIVHACRVPREGLEDLIKVRHRVTFGVVHRAGNLFPPGTRVPGFRDVSPSFFPPVIPPRAKGSRGRPEGGGEGRIIVLLRARGHTRCVAPWEWVNYFIRNAGSGR